MAWTSALRPISLLRRHTFHQSPCKRRLMRPELLSARRVRTGCRTSEYECESCSRMGAVRWKAISTRRHYTPSEVGEEDISARERERE